MASKRNVDGIGGNEGKDGKTGKAPPTLTSTTPPIRLQIENVLGQRTELVAPSHLTIRDVKEALMAFHGGDSERLSLVRCPSGEKKNQNQYTRLEDRMTLKEYGLVDNDRLLLIPTIRTGPVSEESRSVKVFVENNDKISSAIDRLLQGCGKTRKADCRYALAQMDSQKPGDYTILEIPLGVSVSESSDLSDQGKAPSQRVFTAAERKRNLKKNIERQKRKKQRNVPPTSPVARMDAPCGSCGAVTSYKECPRCEQVYCQKHVRTHGCPNQWCRQQ